MAIGLIAAGCASKSAKPENPRPEFNKTCGATPVTAADLSHFNLKPEPGKIQVVRFFRASCPFCKEDLIRIGSLLTSKTWDTERLQLMLVAYKRPGTDNRKTFDEFVRTELISLGVPLESVQIVFLDKTYYELVATRNKAREPILKGWRAVPYTLIFGKDGRLVYRGHFTESEKFQEEHYRQITELMAENC